MRAYFSVINMKDIHGSMIVMIAKNILIETNFSVFKVPALFAGENIAELHVSVLL